MDNIYKMNKLLSLAFFLIAITSFSQSDSSKSKVTGYASIGISVTNSNDFKASSYTAIEGGIVKDNFAFGLILGRGNLSGMGGNEDHIQNYYSEVKATASYPIGILTGNFILGWGSYFNRHTFIEFGGGISYCKGKMGYGVTYSNWDGVNYITPCISFNF